MSDTPTVILPPTGSPPAAPPPRRRRPWRVVLITALVTLVLAVPGAIALLLRDNHAAGPGAQPGTPVPSAPASPSAGPSTEPTPVKPAAPDGHISLNTLRNATLTVPPWPADNVRGPNGRLHFRDGVVKVPFREAGTGQPPYGEQIAILAVTYGDVDRDGAEETIAEIGCLIEGGSKQLVAFDRTAAGRIVTMGTVVATTGKIRDIRTDSARVSSSGTVTADLADYQVCCDDRTPQRRQARGFRWRGGRFDQVSGPTRMPANRYVSQTRVTAGDLVLGPVVDGYRYGTVTVTATHAWGTEPGKVRLIFYPPAGLERAGTTWPTVTADGASFAVTVDAPPVYGRTTYRFAFRGAAGTTSGRLDVELQALSATGAVLSEAVPWDNGTMAPIRTVD